jgi:hypothetical protein
MITCLIQYTLDPNRIAAFREYAERWPPIIERCGGKLIGYFLPKEGANNYAVALIEFESLASYEQYRGRLAEDADARGNVDDMMRSECVLVEARSFLQRVGD